MPVFDLDEHGSPVGMWIKLTVGGVTRLGYGSVPSGQADAVKVLIGDALRNAAMRFGVALDLWAKGDRADPTAENATASAGHAARRGNRQSAGDAWEQSTPAPPRQPQNGSQNGAQLHAAPSWLDTALEKAAKFTTEGEGTELWQESIARANAHEITPADARQIQGLITGQVEYLRTEAMNKALSLLPENDEWRLKVQELADTETAREAIAEVGREVGSKVRAGRIVHAITARWPKAAEQEAAAA